MDSARARYTARAMLPERQAQVRAEKREGQSPFYSGAIRTSEGVVRGGECLQQFPREARLDLARPSGRAEKILRVARDVTPFEREP